MERRNTGATIAADNAVDVLEPAIELVESWLTHARGLETPRSKRTMARLRGAVGDPDGLDFVMGFIDRVVRPDDDRVASKQLHALVLARPNLPKFLGLIDRALLRIGARLGLLLPGIVMPLARRRMRSIVGHLVAPAGHEQLAGHLAEQRQRGFASNVNLLGEAVLGDAEAKRRVHRLLELVDQPGIDYVSVKLSSVVAQLNPWAWDHSLALASDRLACLIDRASSVDSPTLINVDMEEYRDLHLTLDAFEAVLGHPDRTHVTAGIVLQAYLPDALGALQRLSAWAGARVDAGGAPVRVRLVKGANLAMERVEAEVHGWTQAPYATKTETDANYARCVDWVTTADRLRGLHLGIASHNLFLVAWAGLLSQLRGVADHVHVEMLQGMAEAQADAVARQLGDDDRLLLYTPAVLDAEFDVAIGYLFRRLDENAEPDNFLRSLFELAPGSAAFRAEADRFRASVNGRHAPSTVARRNQDRAAAPPRAFEPGQPFRNEPDTDPSLLANRRWLDIVESIAISPAHTGVVTDPTDVERAADTARRAQGGWARRSSKERRETLHRVADELALRRGELIRTMATEAGKTLAEADAEIAEAIDFARYYAERGCELSQPGLVFEPFGLVAVVPPWNFPVAIPAGGAFAALAAGSSVILKPSPEAVRCAELVAEAAHAAGVPEDLLRFLPADEGAAGRAVVEVADAVILTGSTETADLFRSWRPDVRLFAETSGKNALVITPHADIDLAVADLVHSAFSHAGQKCSAASLAILVGSVAESSRFRRQLVDAVARLEVGAATARRNMVGPLIGPPNRRLERALGAPRPGESWLVEPSPIDAHRTQWRPGVLDGVKVDSWFHRTECFGPVLGLMRAVDLDEAIRIQNCGEFGLTGGIHTLDPDEIDEWLDRVEVGNAYVNRHITGAVVQRQPFGGWKRSSVGPGAKAGGPNYVAQLGTWRVAGDSGNRLDDYAEAWATYFATEHDPTGLVSESNTFRYRSLQRIVIRHGPAAAQIDLERFRRACAIAGVEPINSDASRTSDDEFANLLPKLDVERVRLIGVGACEVLHRAANACGVHLITQPVVPAGRVELLHLVREQAISRTLHRFGNLPQNRRQRWR